MMRNQHTRREFLGDVGRGMVAATIGTAAAADLGLATVSAGEGGGRLLFGDLEPLVALMQETPAARIVETVVNRLRQGTELRELVGAAALANARTFGGEDYVGFHTLMALAPAYRMARDLPEDRRALAIVKVLYRNTNRIQESGGRAKEVLHTVEPETLATGEPGAERLREAVRRKDLDGADRLFAGLAQAGPDEAFNDVLYTVQDNTEVHRTVLPYRAWDLLDLLGPSHAQTLLRQSVHYCVRSERDYPHTAETDRPRVLLPKLLDQYKLVGRPLGDRPMDDAWVERTARTIFEGTPDQAAETAAAALAEGIAPDAVGEAISLAANQLVLRDAGRREREVQPGKPLGSVHGDSIGVHACDSANAWRNMARAANPRNTVACLILGAYQVAYDRVNRGGDFLKWEQRPHPEDCEAVAALGPDVLLNELDGAIRENNQDRACALAQRMSTVDIPARSVFDLLLRYAVSEDGALHAEKFYGTTSEEFAALRPAFRWRQVVALARVTASEYGHPAAGVDEACERLGLARR